MEPGIPRGVPIGKAIEPRAFGAEEIGELKESVTIWES